MKIARLLPALAGLFVMSTTVHAQSADTVISYESGTGFATGYTNASSALGLPALGSGVNPLDPPFSKTQLVSIGAGGELTLQMSAPILNNPADIYGLNFIIFANSFFVGGTGSGQNETTTGTLFYHPATVQIQVSADDVNWYTLNPSLTPQPGEWFPTYGGGNPFLPVNPALATTDFAGMTLGQIESLYDGSAGGTGYSLSWAQDAEGNNVDLASVDYVQIDVESGVVDLDAVTVVPEPSTWALLLAGVALFGFRSNKLKFEPMKKMMRVCAIVLFALPAVSPARAVTLTESFTNDPAEQGWQIFGDTNLFTWNSTNDIEEVTWDTTQPNSYLYHSLGTTLTTNDNFTMSFDLQISSIMYESNPIAPPEVSVALLNYDYATNAIFSRANGYTPDLFEFGYFPDNGDGYYGDYGHPSMDGTLTDDTGGIESFPDFNFIYDLLPMATNIMYHVTLSYTAGAYLPTGSVLANGEPYTGFPTNYIETTSIADFSFDTIAIANYENDYNSLYSQGTVSNLVITLPPVVRNVSLTLSNGIPQVQCGTYTGYNYTLERSTNLVTWTPIPPATIGSGNIITLTDPTPPATNAFYQVRAQVP